ncbi:vacuolar transporter chaperone [Actinomortierella ambigua]|uniref:Vacuolar transporter chaperone complex subunit 4 n=1 Tax=Actinomortierella ambigua TaxID=1343610 RepID=A0A9P6QH70_9FUNG|nr:vacuolar transporter chaperone [Actinomortierella ambigua]
MKFGQHLVESMQPEWAFNYISYNELKEVLKTRTDTQIWTEADEGYFVELLERELEKVYSFQLVKVGEIQRKLAYYSSQAQEMKKRQAEEDTWRGLEVELYRLIAEIDVLAKYTRLNYTGFLKIVKKHDKQTRWMLKPIFHVRLNSKPFHKESFDTIIVRLSNIYHQVVARGQKNKGDERFANWDSSAFVRDTTKYWIHPDNITEVKLVIMKHLPVLLFNTKKEYEEDDSAISSVYVDNENFECYQNRLEKTDGAQAIRIRWYGPMPVDNSQCFLERKVHREKWTGEQSVKERFPIKTKYINPYLNGTYTMDVKFAKLKATGQKSVKDVELMQKLANDVQQSIVGKRMRPKVRAFYRRTAFQLQNDARVRISLDTELSLIREDDWSRVRAGDNWKREDVGIDWPFKHLPSEDITRFPYAVLEVKLQTQHGQEPPAWIVELINSHLVESCPRFSKYIHGVATLLEDKIQILPFWLPQMDQDIRKPPNTDFGLTSFLPRAWPIGTPQIAVRPAIPARPRLEGGSSEIKVLGEGATTGPKSLSEFEPKKPKTMDKATYQKMMAENSTRKRPDNSNFYGMPAVQAASKNSLAVSHPLVDHGPVTPLPLPGTTTASATPRPRVNNNNNNNLMAPPQKPWMSNRDSQASLGSQFSSNLLMSEKNNAGGGGKDDGEGADGLLRKKSTIKRRKFGFREKRPGAVKRVTAPVRMEPKVFFANERTFLNWLQFSVLLGSIALTLLNFGDDMSRISGAVLTVITLLAMVYALGIFHTRLSNILSTKPNRQFHDRLGPTALCVFLFGAYFLNFYTKFIRTPAPAAAP